MADETPTRGTSSRGTRTTRTTRGRTSRSGSSTSRGEGSASGDPRVVGRRPAKEAGDEEKPQRSTTRRRPAAKTEEKAERAPRRRAAAAKKEEKAELAPRRRAAAAKKEEEKAERTPRRRAAAAKTEEKAERTTAAPTSRRRPTTAATSRSRSAASKTAEDAPAEEKAEATTTTRRTTRRRSTQTTTADPASADVPVNPAALRDSRAADVVSDEAPKSIEELGQALVEVRRAIEDLGARIETSAKRAKVGVFVDVPNVLYGADHLDGTINMGKLLDYLVGGRDVVRATAYSPVSDDPSEPVERQRFVAPFVPHGYRIVTKPLKRFADGSIKGNFDVEMAIDMVTMAERLDVVSVVSGDSDFARLVEVIQGRGVRVEVVAFAGSTSVEMRSLADRYIELGAIYDQISD